MALNDHFEIIDFHTHPYKSENQNIYYYKDVCHMRFETTLQVMDNAGIFKFCGRALASRVDTDCGKETHLKRMYSINNTSLKLKEIYGERYVPGFVITPLLVRESCEEIERMNRAGVRLIGELTPYLDGWVDKQSSKEFYEILETAKAYDMVVSLHNEAPPYADDIDKLLEENKGVNFVLAHPGAFADLDRNIARMKRNENICIDLSGTGTYYNGVTRRLVDMVGADRVVYGSDYPICSVGAFAGAVVYDPFLRDGEKEKILSLNAKRLLKL